MFFRTGLMKNRGADFRILGTVPEKCVRAVPLLLVRENLVRFCRVRALEKLVADFLLLEL